MKYEFRCECGQVHAVSGADAGMTLSCVCGRKPEVPPLHQLRAFAGEVLFTPAIQVQSLLLAGKLPGTNKCGCCGKETKDVCRVHIECSRAVLRATGSKSDGIAAGCLFGLLTGGLVGIIGANQIMQQEKGTLKEVGQAVDFTLPLPVCRSCQPALDKPTAVSGALRTIPEYAALLDKYPQARIALVG